MRAVFDGWGLPANEPIARRTSIDEGDGVDRTNRGDGEIPLDAMVRDAIAKA
jgi:hypothetical protein